MNKTVCTLLLASLLFSACGGIAPASTPTPLPTNTPLPSATVPPATATFTPVPPTDTPLPTATSTDTPQPAATATHKPSSAPDDASAPGILDEPTEPPLAEWNDIPVMPGAIAGADQGDAYQYTIDTGHEEIYAYYTREMTKRGWEAFATGTGDSGPVMLMFQKGGRMAIISVLKSTSGKTLVMIMLP